MNTDRQFGIVHLSKSVMNNIEKIQNFTHEQTNNNDAVSLVIC